MPIITLTTDFGLRDGYVGAMKGVILSIAHDVQIVDLAHHIPPQDVVHGAFALAHATAFFPGGTIHVGVVDPGVGGGRQPICVACDGQYFVGPNNGLFAICAHEATSWKVYHLENRRYFRETISPTFHGRDIFAPVAAHLANGVDPSAFGPELAQPLPLALPELVEEEDGKLRGTVIYVDSFGNAVTNVRKDNLAGLNPVKLSFEIEGEMIEGLSTTYDDRAPGAALALICSGDLLEIAVRDGSAAEKLRLERGSQVIVRK